MVLGVGKDFFLREINQSPQTVKMERKIKIFCPWVGTEEREVACYFSIVLNEDTIPGFSRTYFSPLLTARLTPHGPTRDIKGRKEVCPFLVFNLST